LEGILVKLLEFQKKSGSKFSFAIKTSYEAENFSWTVRAGFIRLAIDKGKLFKFVPLVGENNSKYCQSFLKSWKYGQECLQSDKLVPGDGSEIYALALEGK